MATEVVEDDEAYREGTQSLDVPSEASILGRGAGIVAGERETALGGSFIEAIWGSSFDRLAAR